MSTKQGGRGSLSALRQRRMLIAEQVVRIGTVTIEDLVELTGVSPMTVYRDVEALEEAGVLQRHRGHVSAVANGLNEAGASFRLTKNTESKQVMAQAVAGRIGPGSSVILDDSTTALWVIRELEVAPLTVVTNSLLVAREVERKSGVRLFMTGGEYQQWAEAFLGKTTIDVLGGIRADYCILSASGISDGQCFHPYEDVVEVKRAMMRSASETILMLDHTKFDRRALHAFARITDFDLVVVDDETDARIITGLRKSGVRVQIAGPIDS